MQKRIGWVIYEEIGFVPVNITPEVALHLAQVKKDKDEAKITHKKKIDNSSCTIEHTHV